MNDKATRREFIAMSAALISASACGRSEQKGASAVTGPLTELSATDAVAAMRAGDMTAETYATALLKNADANAALNAFRTLDADRVLEDAVAADRLRASGSETGSLHGLPIPVKDSVNTRDYPTSGGTRALEHFVPAEDAELVTRLKSAGAFVMGKTNVHELSFGWTSNNYAFGAVRNPYDPDRIPGGSSGGTAAAIAARMAPLGIAEDTQGSIRVPAALCGIYGFRPTQNRYPNSGVVPITPLFDQVGPHTRSVADLALFDHVITGEPIVSTPASLQGVRLGIARDYYYRDLDTEVAEITGEALRKMADAGAELVEVDVPGLQRLIDVTTGPVQLYHVLPMLTRYLDTYGTGIDFDEMFGQVSADIAATFEAWVLPGGANTPSEDDFIAARDIHLPELRHTMATYFAANQLDGMIFPATQVAATPVGQDTLNSEGLPVSLELDGPAGSDRRMLEIGLAIERVTGPLPPPA
jgi:mandelamide amidase